MALDETGSCYEVIARRLRSQVASVAATLRDLGVGTGDRVVGYLPNTPHAIVAFLAAASMGAVWSVCGQDYAPQAATDRFAQLELPSGVEGHETAQQVPLVLAQVAAPGVRRRRTRHRGRRHRGAGFSAGRTGPGWAGRRSAAP